MHVKTCDINFFKCCVLQQQPGPLYLQPPGPGPQKKHVPLFEDGPLIFGCHLPWATNRACFSTVYACRMGVNINCYSEYVSTDRMWSASVQVNKEAELVLYSC